MGTSVSRLRLIYRTGCSAQSSHRHAFPTLEKRSVISRQFWRGVCGFASLVQLKSLWLEVRQRFEHFVDIRSIYQVGYVSLALIAGSVVSGVILLLLFDAWKRIGGPLTYLPVSYHELPRSAVMIRTLLAVEAHTCCSCTTSKLQ